MNNDYTYRTYSTYPIKTNAVFVTSLFIFCDPFYYKLSRSQQLLEVNYTKRLFIPFGTTLNRHWYKCIFRAASCCSAGKENDYILFRLAIIPLNPSPHTHKKKKRKMFITTHIGRYNAPLPSRSDIVAGNKKWRTRFRTSEKKANKQNLVGHISWRRNFENIRYDKL